MKITRNFKFSLLFSLSCINIIGKEPNGKLELLVSTIVKSGTHLVSKVIKGITKKVPRGCKTLVLLDQAEIDSFTSNEYHMTHAPFIPHNYEIAKVNNLRLILLIRDPRDVLISLAHWMQPNIHHWGGYEQSKSVEETISRLIKKYPDGPFLPTTDTIVDSYNMFLGWLVYPNIHVTSFEKLVGTKGGGDDAEQAKEIKKIAAFLNVEITDFQIQEIAKNLFGKTHTFREGQIGGWRTKLSKEQKDAFKAIPGFNDLLIKLNYEKDNNW